MVKVQKVAQARGMTSLSKYLKAKFTETVNTTIQWMMDRKESLGQVHRSSSRMGMKATVTVNPTGDAELWREVIVAVLEDFDAELTVEMLPRYQSVATEVFDKTTVLLGATPPEQAGRIIIPVAKKLASQVTRISNTTRAHMADVIEEGLQQLKTVVEVAKDLRDMLPQRMWSRIPTIARTEMGRAVHQGSALAMQHSGTVLTVMVIGCQAVEPNIPTYEGRPTCNITGVPIHDADKLEFHINHTGTLVPETFVDDVRKSFKANSNHDNRGRFAAGSGSRYSKEVVAAEQAAIEKLKAHTAIHPREYRIAIDAITGKVLAEQMGQQGDSRGGIGESADWTTDEQHRAVMGAERVIDLHTHPDESSFSDGDWGVFAWSHTTKMVVVTKSGGVWSLEKDEKWNSLPWQERTIRKVTERWNALSDEMTENLAHQSVNEFIESINTRMVSEFGGKITYRPAE